MRTGVERQAKPQGRGITQPARSKAQEGWGHPGGFSSWACGSGGSAPHMTDEKEGDDV